MTDTTYKSPNFNSFIKSIWQEQRVWLALALLYVILFIFETAQAFESLEFASFAFLRTSPYLSLSIIIAAGAAGTGADNLIARAFTGAPIIMILAGAVAGGFSPFCSCGVIPLIAALLSMGVPLSAVMAFWLASPLMDPSMFVLTTGMLDFEFAAAKTIAALGLGVMGGFVVHLFSGSWALQNPLREGVGSGGCAGSAVREPSPVVWRFWREAKRRNIFLKDAKKTTLFLAKWLLLAFSLESLMLAWIPAETVTSTLGGQGILPIIWATIVGVPAYLNGYAALPLVGGLIEQGMAPGAGMAFLVAGGVTSIPAAMAVWALARWPVFIIYIALSLTGAFISGVLFQFYISL